MAGENQPTPPLSFPARVEKFFTHEIWVEPAASLNGTRRALRHGLRFCTQIVHGYLRHRLPIRAAALSYTSLLALVPLLAVALSVSKSLLQRNADQFIPVILNRMVGALAPQLKTMPTETSTKAQQEVVMHLQQFLANINARTLGVGGVVALALVSIALLATIEEAFNDIWDVPRGRPWLQRIVYYWTTITLGPLLIFFAMWITASAQFEVLWGKMISWPVLQSVLQTLMPFFIYWIVLAVFYAVMPNLKVRWRPALLGGVAAGTLWQLNNLCAFLYMSKVLALSKIYGVLGIIPILLIGLYFSWFIILLGAEIARSAQNFDQKPRFGSTQ